MNASSSLVGGGSKRELPVLGGVLLVFALVGWWVVSRIQQDYEDFPAYSSLSPKPEGVLALWQLSQRLGQPMERFYDSEYDYPKASAILLIHEDGLDAGSWMFDPYDCAAVLDWVADGNCLVVATPPQSMLSSALQDELGPAELGAFTADPRVVGQFTKAGRPGQSSALCRVFQPGQEYALPGNRPQLWQRIEQLETAGGFGANYLAGASVLLAVSNPPEPIVLQISHGQGEVLWLLRPEVLSNSWLERSDNVELAYALMSYAARYGPVLIDEHVHGYQRPHKSTLQLIVSTTGGWLLLAGLGSILLLLAGRAVLPARFMTRQVAPRRDSTEMVLAQADLYRRAQVTGLISQGIIDSYRRSLQVVLRDSTPMEETTFRAHLRRLLERSGGGRALVASYVSTGVVPRRPAELASFAQELGSLIELARRTGDLPYPRRRLQ